MMKETDLNSIHAPFCEKVLNRNRSKISFSVLGVALHAIVVILKVLSLSSRVVESIASWHMSTLEPCVLLL